MKKRIVMCTNIYPSPLTPEMGSFVRNAYLHLCEALPDVEFVLVKKQFHQGRLGTLISYLAFLRDLYTYLFRRCDLIYAHMVFPTGWLCLPVAYLRSVPLIVYAHGGDVVGANKREMHQWQSSGSLGILNLVKAMTRVTLARAARIHTNSEYLKREAVRIFGISPESILIASMGISTELFSPGAKNPLGAQRTILFVGRMTWQKGFDMFLNLAEELRRAAPGKFQFLCVGRCHDPEYLAKMTASDFRRIDGMDQANLPAIYREAYVTVMPSRYEAFGLVAVESLGCGTPVLAMDVGGLSGIIRNGENGFLFRDDSELLKRFRELEQDYAEIQSRCRDSAMRYEIGKEMRLIAEDCRKILNR